LDQISNWGREERAAVILAGGEGSRLRSLTRKIAGQDIPKQFCPIFGAQTLLEETLRRVALGIEPTLTSVVLTRTHERLYMPILSRASSRNLVVQPQNRGTAPAILYALMRLADVTPNARVAIFPSDHFVDNDHEFMRHVSMAFAVVSSRPELTVLLGIKPVWPETEYGWIEPALVVRDTPAFMVGGFWEKPTAELAKDLLDRGCLWNSFVMVGQLSTLLGLFIIALPSLYLCFKKVRPFFRTTSETERVDRLYRDLCSASFPDEILANAVNLAVLPVRGVEWSDLGEPRRVMETFSRIGIRPHWAAVEP
jgi:mannose-1-phosphate guanylyltransferase